MEEKGAKKNGEGDLGKRESEEKKRESVKRRRGER